MGKRRVLRKTETLFYREERWWLSVPTANGNFRHYDLGRCRDRDEAAGRALEVLSS